MIVLSIGPLRAQFSVPYGPAFTQIKTAGAGPGPPPQQLHPVVTLLIMPCALPSWRVPIMACDLTLAVAVRGAYGSIGSPWLFLGFPRELLIPWGRHP